MRFERTLLIFCVMLAAAGAPALADSGVAPAWSPAWGTPPLAQALAGPGAGSVNGVSVVSWDPSVSSGAVSANMSGVCPMPLIDNSLSPVPLVGSTLPENHATGKTPQTASAVSTAPAMPSVTLVETPHDRSMRAIEVPNGATVLMDGTAVTGGTGFGTAGMGNFTLPEPPALDIGNSGIPSFQVPVLFDA